MIVQFCLGLFGLAALALALRGGAAARWAPFVGLVGQPFWIWFALTARPAAWGLLVLALAYTVVYVWSCQKVIITLWGSRHASS